MKVEVTVKPGSRKGPLIETTPSGLLVYLREKPHDGEANAALIRLLAKHYGVAKSCVTVASGSKSRQKIVEITENPTY